MATKEFEHLVSRLKPFPVLQDECNVTVHSMMKNSFKTSRLPKKLAPKKKNRVYSAQEWTKIAAPANLCACVSCISNQAGLSWELKGKNTAGITHKDWMLLEANRREPLVADVAVTDWAPSGTKSSDWSSGSTNHSAALWISARHEQWKVARNLFRRGSGNRFVFWATQNWSVCACLSTCVRALIDIDIETYNSSPVMLCSCFLSRCCFLFCVLWMWKFVHWCGQDNGGPWLSDRCVLEFIG